MDELGLRRELGQLAGDAVVKARAHRADQIGLVHRVVRRPRPMHPEHAEPLLVRSRKRPQPHQRARHRKTVAAGELDQLARRVRVDDAPAGIDHRAPGRRECLRRLSDLLLVALGRRLIAGQAHIGHRLVLDLAAREVLGDVDQHRPRPTAAGDVKRLVDRPRNLARILDHERVLDDRHRDSDRVRLLKTVGAEQFGPDLAGDENDRNGVHHRVADRRRQVGGAGPARGKCDPHLAGRLRVALGRVPAAGLMPDEDVSDSSPYERVVGGQVRAAGQPEHDVGALGLQTFHDRVNRSHRRSLPAGFPPLSHACARLVSAISRATGQAPRLQIPFPLDHETHGPNGPPGRDGTRTDSSVYARGPLEVHLPSLLARRSMRTCSP